MIVRVHESIFNFWQYDCICMSFRIILGKQIKLMFFLHDNMKCFASYCATNLITYTVDIKKSVFMPCICPQS